MLDPALTILDANRNRALEALRTVEDWARLGLQAPALAGPLRELRHALVRALDRPALQGLLAARDVAGDPGAPGHPAAGSAAARPAALDVVRANLSRAKEALRALEEWTKPLDPAASGAVAVLRFRLYELEPRLLTPRPALAQRRVMVLLGSGPGRLPVLAQAEACLRAGVPLLQLREKTLGGAALLELARGLVAACERAGALLLVNDRPDVARLAGAHGVHLGQEDVPPQDARRIVGPGALVGASAHDEAELTRAAGQGADYLGFGTLYPSATKPGLPAQGLVRLRALAPACPLPIYGIGGVGAANAGEVLAAGAHGVAVSSAVLDAPDPERAAAELVQAVQRALTSAGGGGA